jgi:hypothetical protein
MIGPIDVSEIKQFIENFRSEDQLEKHNKALDFIVEEQKLQLYQKVCELVFSLFILFLRPKESSSWRKKLSFLKSRASK